MRMISPATWKRLRWISLGAGAYLLGAPGCLGVIQQEIEVLGSVDAIGNGLLLRDSFLFDAFGPELFAFFRDFW